MKRSLLILVLLFIACYSMADRAIGYGVSDPVSINTVGADSQYYLIGSVIDQTGAAVPDVDILITGMSFNYQTQTDGIGYFTVGNLNVSQINVHASKNDYEPVSQTMSIYQGPNYCTLVMNEEGAQTSSLVLSSSLIISADNIVQSPNNYYTLSGNVNINGILMFPGEVYVDKRANLEYPRVEFWEGAQGINIDGQDRTIVPNVFLPLTYSVIGNTLVPVSFAYFIDADIQIGGFDIEIGRLTIGETQSMGKYVEIMGMFKPLDNSFFSKTMDKDEWVDTDEPPRLFIPTLESLSVSLYYGQNSGISFGCSIQDLSCNFKVFSIDNLYLNIDPAGELFSGGLKIKIPGMNIPGRDTILTEELFATPVQIIDSEKGLTTLTDLETFVNMFRQDRFSQIVIELQMEFLSGRLNMLSVDVSGLNIAIFNTGTFVRRIAGGVYDMAVNDMRIEANVDIGLNSNLDLPFPGQEDRIPVVYISNVGTVIKPWSYFKGSGELQMFRQPLANAEFVYDGNKRALNLEGNVTFMYDQNNPNSSILEGKLYGTIRNEYFNAGMRARFKTPDDLPWYLKWAEGITLASAEVDIENFVLSSSATYLKTPWKDYTIAQRCVFGKETFPWFHYYIGTNYKTMLQVWRGTRDGRYTVDFLVPENSGQIMVVAGNDINLFDITISDPNGSIYNNTYEGYYQFTSSQQTVVIIDYPVSGDWTFSTDQTGDITVEFKSVDQTPTYLMTMPSTRGSRNNNIQLYMTDYSDTLNVKVYYNTNNRSFDGVFIQEFDVVNNADIEFVWYNDDVENGEYFIYTRIDDRKNAPVLQYAPGSIIVENYYVEAPQNVNVSVVNDSILVSWNDPVDPNILVTEILVRDVYYKSRYAYGIAGENHYTIGDVPTGREYEVLCRFGNNEYRYSDYTSGGTIIYTGSNRNSPPYFTMDPDDLWVFIENEPASYELSANSPQGGNISFSLLEGEMGMSINGSTFSWTPTPDQRGFYQQPMIASNAYGEDIMHQQIIVYSEEQAEIQVSFSSFNLYEEDNMFVKISNMHSEEYYQDVTLTNLISNEQVTVQCRRVNDFDYIGQFSLSVNRRTEIPVQDGDHIEASYYYDGQTYYAISIYSSNPQPSDNIPPAAIDDLEALYVDSNSLILSWTATGDDGHVGRAYRYDIRYSYTEIEDHDDYLVASILTRNLYPSMAGVVDSLIVDLNELENYTQNDSVFFAIIVEDAHQNRSEVSNCAAYSYLASPYQVNAQLINDAVINVSWIDLHNRRINEHRRTRSENRSSREEVTFIGYKLTREHNNLVEILAEELTEVVFADTIIALNDGPVKYGVAAVYQSGSSEKEYSNTIILNRLVDLRIYCQQDSIYAAAGVEYTITGQDSLYQHNFAGQTNSSGIILIDNIYKTVYTVELIKDGCFPAEYLIEVTDSNNEFVLNIYYAPPPENLSIEIQGNVAIVSWEPVVWASYYKIYVSDNPYAEDWGVPISIQEATYIEIPIIEEKMFFRVVAGVDYE